MIPPKGAKQPKNAKDKKAPSVESREESNGAEVHRGGVHLGPLARNGWCSQPLGCHNLGVSNGACTHLAKALEQPLLLLRDMEGLRCTKQPDLLMSLKRDLAMISQSTSFVVKY